MNTSRESKEAVSEVISCEVGSSVVVVIVGRVQSGNTLIFITCSTLKLFGST